MYRNFGIKPSPAKWAFLAPLFSALGVGGGAAGAAGTAAAVAGKALAGTAISKATQKKPNEIVDIASGVGNKEIMPKSKENDTYA